MIRGKRGFLRAQLLLICFWIFSGLCLNAQEAEEEKIEFFYENVCASCEGDADFFRLYEECLTREERTVLQGKVFTYNVFLDSCREHYEERRESLGIPSGTQLPVLAAGERWVSGLEQMEELLHEAAAAAESGEDLAGDPYEESASDLWIPDVSGSARTETSEEEAADQEEELSQTLSFVSRVEEDLQKEEEPVVILFTTQSCEDCERAEDQLFRQQKDSGGRVLVYNIIRDPAVDFLKAMFRTYGVEEQKQKVPALFYGDQAATGAEAIEKLTEHELWGAEGNRQLLSCVRQAGEALQEKESDGGRQGLLTLAGAGLLAGMNPCSISMLLMLLSMIVAEKASVWRNGLLYLCGKYAAYFSIGLIIYVSASGLDEAFLQNTGQILNRILVLLFVLAGILYLADAVRVFKQDYGRIRTQLPGRMRRWNHGLIRKAGSYRGILQPLLIIGLGMAISVGEFFCTGQIYMASITYLLKEQVGGVWLYFLVYVTAMSFPALVMLMIIQRTRNTEHISEFMLRHLGAVKIFNGLLFLAFAVYFLLH